MNRIVVLATTGILALGMLAAACGDDDDGNAEDAEALGDAYVEFTTALNGTTDISNAADETKDRLTDNCDELAGVVDDDNFDDLCGTLNEAVDDEDQVKFDQAKSDYQQFDPEVRAAVEQEIGDVAATDDDDDEPLQGGDDNPDDSNDDNADDDGGSDDGGTVPDVDNPLDDEDDN